MKEKDYDLFMNIVRNPTMSFGDFLQGGINIDNTQLLDRTQYENSAKVQEAFSDENGDFNKELFNKTYDIAASYYNVLSNEDNNKLMQKQFTYHRDDIFAPIEQREQGPQYQIITMSNPYKQSNSVFELGKVGAGTESTDELAQKNKILLNPTTAGPNLENAKWGDSPNDTFFSNFFETLVLAQYEEDGTHTDLLTGETVEHKKGQYKTDAEGNFYYEKLDGRDIYGRKVLNKMNILTTDGSYWNEHFDFFDSDDIEQKSIGSSILKNAALVGSMFIPYVGPWIAGASVASQLVGLTGTLGKMLTGSDNETFSSMEGWAKSVSRQGAQTEYAQENTWCWENFINLIGDVAGQLKEQRFIFERIPAIVKGSPNLLSESGRTKQLTKLQAIQDDLYKTKVDDLIKNGLDKKDLALSLQELNLTKIANARQALELQVNKYQKLGEVLSKGYMTGITVIDTYGEAKQAGASDLDATLLTLGYAAGEYALLNTGIGDWILPELRANRYKNKAIAEALAGLKNETQTTLKQLGASLKNLPKENKKEYVKKVFNIGRDLAKNSHDKTQGIGKAFIGAGLGEGVEEVSEELLADFSKGCYDVVKWLQGDDTRLNTFGYDFNTERFDAGNLLDRYGMSLVGGFIGGGLTNIGTSYQTLKSLSDMTPKQAIEELVYMSRNGQIQDFIKQIDKMRLGDPNLSITTDKNFNPKPGTETDNQDFFIKKAIKEQVNIIEGILNANGAKKSNQSFLNIQTLGDLRFSALQSSTMAGAYINEFQNLVSDIVKLTSKKNTIAQSSKDTTPQDGKVSDQENRKQDISEEDKQIIKQIESQLKEKQELLSDLLEGKRSAEFIADALFEMTTDLSGNLVSTTFPLFAENKYGKKLSELTEQEKAITWKEYETWKVSEGREKIKTMARIFRNMTKEASATITQSIEAYKKVPSEINELNTLLSESWNPFSSQTDEEWLQQANEIQTGVTFPFKNLLSRYGTSEEIEKLNQINNKLQHIDSTLSREEQEKVSKQLNKEFKDLTADIVLNNLDKYVQPFLTQGFANYEVKNQLLNLSLVAFNRIKNKVAEFEQFEEEFGDPFNPAENPYITQQNYIKELRNQIDNLSNTPIEQNLDSFSISIGNTPIKISELFEKLNSTFQEKTVNQFNTDLAVELDNALNTIHMYRAAILAAKTDDAKLGDIFGYNATVNEVSGTQELAEIDQDTANIFIADIDTLLNKLLYLKKLYYINQGQKLSKQNRVSIKKDLLVFKRLKHIINIPDQEDDPLKHWQGFSELQQAINNASLHNQYLTNNITDTRNKEEHLNFHRENQNIEDAVYNFFQKNQDKLNNIDKLTEFINPKRLQLYTRAQDLLNEDLKNMDDNALVWWLATRAAVKFSDFHGMYKDIIDTKSENPVAPISTQELAIYQNYASVVNGNIFTQFYKAYRKSMLEDWKNKTLSERQEMAKLLDLDAKLLTDEMADYAINFLTLPRFQNIVLTEGIPGSGKTNAVFKTTIKLLEHYNPEVLSNVFVIHGADVVSEQDPNGNKNAENLVKELGLKSAKAFGRPKFMKQISPDWKEHVFENNVSKVPKTDYFINEEHEIKSSLQTAKTTTYPSLIIIDEVSKFSVYDLDQIDNYAKEYGITVLVAGDFDQIGVVGGHKVEINGSSYDWLVNLDRTNFIRTFKLGVSMRTDNLIKTNDLVKMQAFMQSPNLESSPEFEYYQDNELGIFGDKVYNYTYERDSEGNISTDKNIMLSQILPDLELMISTLKDGEKIGYIYSDINSPIYKELSQDKYSKFIELKQGGVAQGSEGQYYIIELDYNDNSDLFLRTLYTGMSRAKQGSIILAPFNKDIYSFKSKQISNLIIEPTSRETYNRYAAEVKNTYDQLVTSYTVPKLIKRTVENQSTIHETPKKDSEGLDEAIIPSTEASSNKPTSSEEPKDDSNKGESEPLPESTSSEPEIPTENPPSTEVSTENLGSTEPVTSKSIVESTSLGEVPENLIYEQYITPITDTDVIPESNYKEQIDISNNDQPSTQDVSVDQDTQNISIKMLLHSFNTFELGVQIDEDGNIQPSGDQSWMDTRIDSINGLVKVDQLINHPQRTADEYIQILGTLRSILFNTVEKSELEKRVKDFLKLPDIYITFAYKSSARVKPENSTEYVDKNPTVLGKSKNEKTLFNGSSDTKSQNIHYKSLVAIIGTKESGNILELPLLAFSSPFTLIQTVKDGKRVFGELYDYYKNHSKENLHELSLNIQKEFKDNPKYKDILNLFKLFDFTDNGVFYLRDSQWTPFRNCELLGPEFCTNKGYNQIFSGMDFNVDDSWIPVQDYIKNPQITTTRILTSIQTQTEYDRQLKQLVKPGHSFMLVSFDKTLDSEAKIVDYYLQQEMKGLPKKVQMVYVLPPKASFKEYINNLKDIFQGNKQNVEPIGQLFTSYKLLKVLMQNDTFKKRLNDKYRILDTIEKALSELEGLSKQEIYDRLYKPQNWSGKSVPLAGLFDRVLLDMVYDKNSLGEQLEFTYNESDFQMMEQILSDSGIDGIYYNSKLKKVDTEEVGPFKVLNQEDYTINGKPYLIHGKIDSYTFRADMGGFVQYMINQMYSKDGHQRSKDTNTYWYKNSNIFSTPKSPEDIKKENTLKYLKSRTGLDYSHIYNSTSFQDANKKVVNLINNNDNGLISFIINNEVVVSSKNDIFNGNTYVQDQEGNPLYDITPTADSNGNYYFELIVNNISYSCEYNGDILTMTPTQIEQKSQLTLSINDSNFTELKSAGIELLEDVFAFDPDLEILLSSATYDDFINNISNLMYIGEQRMEDIDNALSEKGDDNPNFQIIAQDLKNIEEYINPDKQDEAGMVCPTDIKIKF